MSTGGAERPAVDPGWSSDQQALLEMIARGAPLPQVLEGLAGAIERRLPGMRCSVLQLDQATRRLWSVASPRIPAPFLAATNGGQIGPLAGSCGTAAYFRRTIIVRDIATDPLWVPWRRAALDAGLRSCWSTPILGTHDEVLGTFAMYGEREFEPSALQQRLATDATHLASIAMERSRTEEALLARESRLREITESVGEVFYSAAVDPGGRVLKLDYVSPTVERVWGIDRAVLAASPSAWMDAIHPEDLPAVQHRLHARLEGVAFDFEYRIRHPDGTTRWIHDRNVPVRDANGQVARFVGSASDITARKQAEERLAESELRLARLIQSAMDAIVSVDEHGSVVIFNAAAETIFRVPAAEVIGKPIDRFIEPEQRDLHRRQVEEFARAGTTARTATHPAQVYGVRADGERFPMEATISRAEVNGRPLLTVILRDLSDRERLEVQVRQSQRMDAMGRLAGGVAHDFNNLLTAIRAGAETLSAELPEGPLRDDANDILATADRAAALTRQLLAFSRTQVLQRDVVELNRVVRGMETLLRRVMSESVALVVETTTDSTSVLADASQLEQIIVNLVINARDAIGAGGRIRIRTLTVPTRSLPPQVASRASFDSAGLVVLLAVDDDGGGMDEATRARAFEPFFTTKEPGRGTGLGLATVYGIVEQSQGSATIESAPGRGTTVWIALPSAVQKSASPPRPSSLEPMRGSGTVLLVEDEPAVRSVAHRVLARAGYTLIEATNGAEAMHVWETHRLAGSDTPAIDLVITDMVMPEMSGRDLVRALRAAKPELPVLFMSGYLEGGLVDGELGPHTTFLEKPFTSQRLLERVKELLPG